MVELSRKAEPRLWTQPTPVAVKKFEPGADFSPLNGCGRCPIVRILLAANRLYNKRHQHTVMIALVWTDGFC